MAKEKHLLQIGSVSKQSGLSIDTIRYYEKEGLIERPLRSEGGFRLYDKNTVARLSFIKKAQQYGFTLIEIKKIMSQSKRGLKPCCTYVGGLLKSKMEELEGKITELKRTIRGLKDMMESWIPTKKVKKKDFVVCPQIERTQRKGDKRNGKAKG